MTMVSQTCHEDPHRKADDAKYLFPQWYFNNRQTEDLKKDHVTFVNH